MDWVTTQQNIMDILESNNLPIQKVRKIVALGMEQEEAELMVERYESGISQPVYYEKLSIENYSDEADDLLRG